MRWTPSYMCSICQIEEIAKGKWPTRQIHHGASDMKTVNTQRSIGTIQHSFQGRDHLKRALSIRIPLKNGVSDGLSEGTSSTNVQEEPVNQTTLEQESIPEVPRTIAIRRHQNNADFREYHLTRESMTNRILKILLGHRLPIKHGEYAFNDLPTQIVQAHGSLIQDHMDHGWDGYLFTFMFQQIPGSVETQIQQMHTEIDRVYRRLVTRVVRNPRLENWAWLLPKGVFYPDIPGLKPSKQSLRDVRVNNGLHFHGVMVANRWARMKERLDIYFQEKGSEYLSAMLRRIDVGPITHRPDFVADYAGKAIKR